MFFIKKWIKLINSYTIKRKSFPLYLDHLITSQCNASCSVCYLRNNDSTNVSLETLTPIIKSFGYLRQVTITGGEPFLNSDIFEIAKLYITHNHCRNLTFITNGSLPQVIYETIFKIINLKKNIKINVLISIDDTNIKHDQYRQVPSLSQKISSTIELLSGFKNVTIGSVTCINSTNVQRIVEIKNYLLQLNLHNHAFTIARNSSGSPLIKEFDFTYLIEHASNFIEYATLKLMDLMINKKLKMKCYAGILKMTLNSDGNLLPCELLHHHTKGCHCTMECQIWMNATHNPSQLLRLLILRVLFAFQKFHSNIRN